MDNILKSSKGDGSISRTVKGILTAFIPVILGVAQAYNVEVDRSVVVDFITVATGIVALFTTGYGLVAKVVNRNMGIKM